MRTSVLRPAAGHTAWLLALAMGGAALLGGCASAPDEHTAAPVDARVAQTPAEALLEPGVKVPLPTVHGIVPATFHQLMTIGYRDQTQQLQTVLEIAPGSLSLAGLTPAGIRLFEGRYDGVEVSTELAAGMEKMPPVSQVLLDVMLSLCPPDRFTLPPGYVLQDRGWLHRELYAPDGSTVYAIEYDDALGSGRRLPVSISHQVFGYQVSFRYLPSPQAEDAGEDEVSAEGEEHARGKPRRGKRFGRDLMGRPINQDGTVDYSQIRQRSSVPARIPGSLQQQYPQQQYPQQLSLPTGLPGLMQGGQSTLQSFPMPTSSGQ